jgi:predicted lactoylglutathione lyase
MSRKLFVNLPVKNLDASVAFFGKLGFSFDAQFTDESATAMTTHTEAILCVSAESRAEVDELVNTAISAGGRPANDPMDHGFMYGWSFQDIDGHLWEVMYMDPSALAQQ